MTFKQVTTEWKVGRNTMLTIIHDDMFPEQLRVLVGAYDLRDSAQAQSHTLVMDKGIIEDLIRSLYEAQHRVEMAHADRLRAEAQAEDEAQEQIEDTAAYLTKQGVVVTEADPF